MLSVKINNSELNKILKNVIQYSNGFFDGIDMKRTDFNKELASFTSEALKKYIDSQARMNPSKLHHVYEWHRVGNAESRLFDFNTKVSSKSITFTGNFLPSQSSNNNSNEPFLDKANVMENSIEVVIEPKNGDVLVFEDKGETVFTTKTIYIEHPGGDEVAGSFGLTVNNFFENYFTSGLLKPLLNKLSTPTEYTQSFSIGAKEGKKNGTRAGKKYLTVSGGIE